MKRIAIYTLALMLCLSAVSVSEAGCGLLGWRPLKNVANRRAEGRGLFQKNGPLKRAARGTR